MARSLGMAQRILTLLFGLAVISVTAPTFACSCRWQGTFETVAKKAPVVVKAKVVGTKSFDPALIMGLDETKQEAFQAIAVEVAEVLKGSFGNWRLELLGDNGFECRLYLLASRFVIGDEYLFVLRSDLPTQELSICGEHWVRVQGSSYLGQDLAGEGYQQPLNLLRENLTR
ncbi:MAG: hypothetical protein AAF358_19855 [Pseudomonadota bacterium]